MVLAMVAPDMSSVSQAREKPACRHCGSAVADDVATSPYCCAGCQAVAALLREEGLGRYYALAGGDVRAVGAVPGGHGHAWLDERRASVEKDALPGTLCSLQLDVQGVHCAACVWLMNETFRRAGGAAITVNPALGKIAIAYARGRFDVDAWVTSVERFGYQLGPSRKRGSQGPSGLTSLTWRLGISAALAASSCGGCAMARSRSWPPRACEPVTACWWRPGSWSRSTRVSRAAPPRSPPTGSMARPRRAHAPRAPRSPPAASTPAAAPSRWWRRRRSPLRRSSRCCASLPPDRRSSPAAPAGIASARGMGSHAAGWWASSPLPGLVSRSGCPAIRAARSTWSSPCWW